MRLTIGKVTTTSLFLLCTTSQVVLGSQNLLINSPSSADSLPLHQPTRDWGTLQFPYSTKPAYGLRNNVGHDDRGSISSISSAITRDRGRLGYHSESEPSHRLKTQKNIRMRKDGDGLLEGLGTDFNRGRGKSEGRPILLGQEQYMNRQMRQDQKQQPRLIKRSNSPTRADRQSRAAEGSQEEIQKRMKLPNNVMKHVGPEGSGPLSNKKMLEAKRIQRRDLKEVTSVTTHQTDDEAST